MRCITLRRRIIPGIIIVLLLNPLSVSCPLTLPIKPILSSGHLCQA